MSAEQVIDLSTQGDVAIVTINHPPVNSLSSDAFRQLGEQFQKAIKDPKINAIVLVGAGDTFSAGFDLSSVDKLPGPDTLRQENPRVYKMLDAVEDSPKPVVAAIKGVALGGGLEVALGCHYRVAGQSSSLGLPEVQVGLLPGGGGTQRLPRLVGLQDGLLMICQGQQIKAPKALEIGLVDQLAPDADVLNHAIAFARSKVGETSHPKARTKTDKLPPKEMAEPIFQFAASEVAKKAGQMIAPGKALECIKVGVLEGYEKGLNKELENFIHLAFSDQAEGLIHFFFASRATTRIPELKGVDPGPSLKKIGVVGGGTMGRDITFVHLISGKEVVLLEADQTRLDAAVDVIKGHFQRRVDQGRMTSEKMAAAVGRLKPTLDYADFAGAQLVIEAVFEKMDVKREVFVKLNKVVSASAILASNTSTLPISELSSVIDRPERMIGLHFFSPARVMPLLEIIRTKKTSPQTIAACLQLSKEIKKTPVLVGDCYGFLTNRIAMAYGAESNAILDEGASVEQIDKALVRFGLPMGPFTMGDMAGNDIGYHAAPGMIAAYPKRSRSMSPVAKLMFEAGRHGQKTGKGFYRYPEGQSKGEHDPEFDALLAQARTTLGKPPRTDISDREIVERIMFTWVNAAADCLHEGIALKPGDVDVATVMGFGFPPWRGGLMHYAQREGFSRIVDALDGYAKKFGPVYEPSPWLRERANVNKT